MWQQQHHYVCAGSTALQHNAPSRYGAGVSRTSSHLLAYQHQRLPYSCSNQQRLPAARVRANCLAPRAAPRTGGIAALRAV